MPSQPDVSVVTVSRNTRDLLRQCLTSLESDRAIIEVLLIDAASADGSAEMVAREFGWVRLLPARENLGFTRGNNRGLRVARGRHLLLLNPDTAVQTGAIEAMASYLDGHPDVGAVGPQLRFGDGSVQRSRYRFPGKATGFVESTVLERLPVSRRLVRDFYLQDRRDDELQEVDWLRGACLMIRRETARAVGLLDEGFFMYSEETDLCRRIRSAGWKIVYLPRAVVVHHEGKSSEQVPAARDLHFHESRFRYYRKHHGRGWAAALRVAVLGHFLYLTAEESGKLMLGHKVELRRQRLANLRQVLAAQARRLVGAA
jgi:N-acetylglucosaminyl-diphospho-decaprenol L-rhamnosyltransferase